MTTEELQKELDHLRKQLEHERKYNKLLLDATRHYAMSLLEELKQLRETHNPYAPDEE